MAFRLTVADPAGYCFGVQLAVDIVEGYLDSGEKLYTLGPIIHNRQVVDDLAARGAEAIDSLPEVDAGRRIVIRAHGVPRSVVEALEAGGYTYTDATCPYVKRIHDVVTEVPESGKVIVIGDPNHPEVIGIRGHTAAASTVVRDAEELESYLQTCHVDDDITVVAQTTLMQHEWLKCKDIFKKGYTKSRIFDTICSATMQRQEEARRLAQISDLMLVIGGRHSSNTTKLAAICSEVTQTLQIETADELRGRAFAPGMTIGIAAGTSTPPGIIKEVRETMSEIMSNQEELSFEEMLEQSLKSVRNGEKVMGIVTTISPTEVGVDIGTKHAGYIPLGELTDDPTASIEDLVKKGDELELMVVRVNDVEGTVMLSKKRLDAAAGFEKVMGAADTEEVLEGVVTEVIKGGLLALTNGVKVFIPASHATLSRTEDLTPMLRQKVSFRILEVNRQRRRAVGSIKAVLREARKEQEQNFWETVEVGQKFTGTVKSLTDYGAFIDLGGVDGMIHVSELSWSKVRHPSQVVQVGQTVEVYVKELDPEKKKISLGYKRSEENPWSILENNYAVGQDLDVKIVSLTTFGAFAELIPGIDGLIHISQLATHRVGKPADVVNPGDVVRARITELDFERKRVSLSIRAVQEEGEAADVEAYNATQEAPAVEEVVDAGVLAEEACAVAEEVGTMAEVDADTEAPAEDSIPEIEEASTAAPEEAAEDAE